MTETDRREFLQRAAGTMAAFAIQPTLELERGGAPADGRALRVGLVGAGRQGRAILAELAKLEQFQVAAVCDSLPARLRSGQRRARGAAAFADHRAMLDKGGVDAVIVATPTDAHRAVAIDALEAGKHVYCEAPLAASIDDARAIARAARTAGKVFQTGLLARCDPIYKLAWSFYRSGSLRDLVALQAQSHQKTSWRVPSSDPAVAAALNWRLDEARSTGLPGEEGTHQFDVFHWFVGSYPTAVRGVGGVRYHKDGRAIADTVRCDLSFDDGVHLAWGATLCNSQGGRFEQLDGSMATIKLAWNAGWMFKEADAPTQGWEAYANRETFHNDEGITLIADATKLAKQGKLREGVGLPHPPEYYGLADFANSALEGAEVVCSAEEGFRATVVGICAQRAVTGGVEVAIGADLLKVE